MEELLILLSSGEVLTIGSGERPQGHVVNKLKDFSEHYLTPRPHTADIQLFSLHTYCGIFSKGEMRYNYQSVAMAHCNDSFFCRLYEMLCGEMVWGCGEHEGHQISLLAPPLATHWIGMYDSSGVWMLRSQRLSEHTQLLSQALFPITTNADEVYKCDNTIL